MKENQGNFSDAGIATFILLLKFPEDICVQDVATFTDGCRLFGGWGGV